MLRRTVILVGVLLLALIPAAAMAQSQVQDDNEDDVLIRINGPLHLARGDTAGTVVAISDDVTVAGTITESLLVIDGHARISGEIDGDVVVISGEVELMDAARITGDLNLYDSELVRAGGAVVEGSVHERETFTWSAWDTFVFSAILWVALTLLTLFIALLFAAAGGRQLVTSARLITERPGPTALAALLGGVLIPVLGAARIWMRSNIRTSPRCLA
jgi:cytoskeletal protein CcmA (bactofilin family)